MTKTISQAIGEATNNQAEYRAVLAALNWLKNQPPAETTIFLDSQLLVEQLNGNYKVKNSELKNLHSQTRALIMELGGRIGFQYIPREQNRAADQLVNEVLDKS
ncbi:MAG: ribonuclease H [Candidatus Berkelbacteria bacterium Licking1014_2]|uniref:Ribonuclease H n=1 Tax=Candidatus Berkelbacteria bacterium Licking1014_2 TaxID=2017146 RepID=A0A554LRJ8_9BACT|nr:MAG: ribonuclease H [Candidatus Berkelbacteria bacterium Licking1014_2]